MQNALIYDAIVVLFCFFIIFYFNLKFKFYLNHHNFDKTK